MTPIIEAAEATRIGFSLVLYANAALQGAILGMETALKALRDKGVLEEGAVASFAERQRLVDKASFDAMETSISLLAARRADGVIGKMRSERGQEHDDCRFAGRGQHMGGSACSARWWRSPCLPTPQPRCFCRQ